MESFKPRTWIGCSLVLIWNNFFEVICLNSFVLSARETFPINESSDANSSKHSFHVSKHCISLLEKFVTLSTGQPRFFNNCEKILAQKLGS